MFYVYILYSKQEDIYYKGFSTDIEKRLEYHNNGKSNFTSKANDWELRYSIAFETKTEALLEEKRLKRLNRASLERLIQSR
ncbi:GIY-YIG nuclease family protein [Flavobacterium sp.]|uniref:GIY-YIG nuclease family protein n=1 Tax=Flavobacterium sp. TaxID=239 RepID=UPI003D6B6D78